MKKLIRKKAVKKVAPKPEPVELSFRDKLGIKLLVLQAQLNSLKLRVVLTVRNFAAKLRGH